jgi:hypothetical protein
MVCLLHRHHPMQPLPPSLHHHPMHPAPASSLSPHLAFIETVVCLAWQGKLLKLDYQLPWYNNLHPPWQGKLLTLVYYPPYQKKLLKFMYHLPW